MYGYNETNAINIRRLSSLVKMDNGVYNTEESGLSQKEFDKMFADNILLLDCLTFVGVTNSTVSIGPLIFAGNYSREQLDNYGIQKEPAPGIEPGIFSLQGRCVSHCAMQACVASVIDICQ